MNKKLLSMIKKALCCGMALSMAAGSVLPAKAAENASLIATMLELKEDDILELCR